MVAWRVTTPGLTDLGGFGGVDMRDGGLYGDPSTGCHMREGGIRARLPRVATCGGVGVGP